VDDAQAGGVEVVRTFWKIVAGPGLTLVLLTCTIACPQHSTNSGAATIPATGHKADLLVHMEYQPPVSYPDWPGAVYFTANQVKVEEFSIGPEGVGGVVREYLSDTGSLTFNEVQDSNSRVGYAMWLKGGDPLPGGPKSAWAGGLPFCAIGLRKDFVLQQLKASPAITISPLSNQVIRGENCEGIRITLSGPAALPGIGPSELWFSQTYGVVWQANSTKSRYGGDLFSIGLANVQSWTPIPSKLRLQGYMIHDWRD
jgi:hypothetical protein